MPYYGQMRGDYRTYGYGQGDPGFLSGLWKGVKRFVVPALAGAIAGPFGAGVARAAMMKPSPGIMSQRAQPRQDVALRMGPIAARSTDFYPPVPQFAGPGMGRARATGMENLGGMPSATGCCPRGFHLAKDGSGKCVRNRRMNVANPRALRRSMRRVQGFEKLARRTISFTRRVKMKK